MPCHPRVVIVMVSSWETQFKGLWGNDLLDDVFRPRSPVDWDPLHHPGQGSQAKNDGFICWIFVGPLSYWERTSHRPSGYTFFTRTTTFPWSLNTHRSTYRIKWTEGTWTREGDNREKRTLETRDTRSSTLQHIQWVGFAPVCLQSSAAAVTSSAAVGVCVYVCGAVRKAWDLK